MKKLLYKFLLLTLLSATLMLWGCQTKAPSDTDKLMEILESIVEGAECPYTEKIQIETVHYAAAPNISSAFCPTVSCENGQIYVGTAHYDSITYTETPEISYDILIDRYNTVGDDDRVITLHRLFLADSCYILNKAANADGPEQLLIYNIGGVLFVVDPSMSGISYAGTIDNSSCSEPIQTYKDRLMAVLQASAEGTPIPYTDRFALAASCCAKSTDISASDSFMLLVDGGIVTIGGSAYSDVAYIEDPDYSFEGLISVCTKAGDTDTADMLRQLSEQGSCFLISAENAAAYGSSLAVYRMDGIIYLAGLDPSGSAYRVNATLIIE